MVKTSSREAEEKLMAGAIGEVRERISISPHGLTHPPWGEEDFMGLTMNHRFTSCVVCKKKSKVGTKKFNLIIQSFIDRVHRVHRLELLFNSQTYRHNCV